MHIHLTSNAGRKEVKQRERGRRWWLDESLVMHDIWLEMYGECTCAYYLLGLVGRPSQVYACAIRWVSYYTYRRRHGGGGYGGWWGHRPITLKDSRASAPHTSRSTTHHEQSNGYSSVDVRTHTAGLRTYVRVRVPRTGRIYPSSDGRPCGAGPPPPGTSRTCPSTKVRTCESVRRRRGSAS